MLIFIFIPKVSQCENYMKLKTEFNAEKMLHPCLISTSSQKKFFGTKFLFRRMPRYASQLAATLIDFDDSSNVWKKGLGGCCSNAHKNKREICLTMKEKGGRERENSCQKLILFFITSTCICSRTRL